MTTKITQIRQGDVLLVRTDRPHDLIERLDEAGLFVPGERTGHAHELPAEVWRTRSQRVLHVTEPQVMRHLDRDGNQADHQPVTVPAGWWVPITQRQYEHRRSVSRSRYD